MHCTHEESPVYEIVWVAHSCSLSIWCMSKWLSSRPNQHAQVEVGYVPAAHSFLLGPATIWTEFQASTLRSLPIATSLRKPFFSLSWERNATWLTMLLKHAQIGTLTAARHRVQWVAWFRNGCWIPKENHDGWLPDGFNKKSQWLIASWWKGQICHSQNHEITAHTCWVLLKH